MRNPFRRTQDQERRRRRVAGSGEREREDDSRVEEEITDDVEVSASIGRRGLTRDRTVQAVEQAIRENQKQAREVAFRRNRCDRHEADPQAEPGQTVCGYPARH